MRSLITSLLFLTAIPAIAQKTPRTIGQQTHEESLVNCDELADLSTSIPPESRPYEFARAAIASLWYASKAAHVPETEQARKNPDDTGFRLVTAMMRDAKYSSNYYICAKRAIGQFVDKNNGENTSIAASALWIAYDQNIDLNQRMLALLKQLGRIPQAEVMDQLSSLEVERSDRIKDMTQPSAVAFLSLIDPERADDKGHATFLIITKEQKKTLVDWTMEHFPEFKDEAKTKWNDDASADAHLLFNVLSGRTCKDEGVVAKGK